LCSHSIHVSGTEANLDSIQPKRNFISRVYEYFNQSNNDKPEKSFDITVLGGPSYSNSTSFYIAALAAGVYQTARDSITPVSDATLHGRASITGFYSVGFSGNHFSQSDKFRIVYKGEFVHFPLKFWGLGYNTAHNNDNESKYTELQTSLKSEFTWRIGNDIFVGPTFDIQYTQAKKIERPELWDDTPLNIFNCGIGLLFSFDTRDYTTNATRGCNLRVSHKFFPKFLGNPTHFSATEATASWYKRVWPSGVLAMQAHAFVAHGHITWNMMPTVDQSNVVRGYYEGRYRDNNEADAVIELRQHVWDRIGVVVWGGAGTIFKELKQVKFNTILPTYGIGLRWELKKRVNIRCDVGFGKHSTGLTLGMHETF
jgi:outer membrane protein assembly factor BamA